MPRIIAFIRAALAFLLRKARALWRWFRSQKRVVQGLIVAGLIVAIIGLGFLLNSGKAAGDADTTRVVTVRSVAELSGNASGGSAIGTVRSVTEAELLAQASGPVTAVHSTVGASVPAGFVLAELENSAQSAGVLSAQGSYDAAVAARAATSLGNTTASAQDAYRNAYATLDSVLTTEVDLFFGAEGANGPQININSNGQADVLGKKRAQLDAMMDVWRASLATADSAQPISLLATASTNARSVSDFLTQLAVAANGADSRATDSQLAALAAARASVSGLLSTLSAATASYRSGAVGATASSDASVKQALGALRLAQSNYEKTIIRASIAGTVNYLPIHAGDYVNALEHVASVAQNGALEIDTFVSEDVRSALAVGTKVEIEGGASGVVTQISPALDPITKQIDVRIAVAAGGDTLVNGQSVRIALPSVESKPQAQATQNILLPLAAVKLTSNARQVFTVSSDGRLTAIPVTIGDVVGDRILITSTLPGDTRIIVDARGLSEGQKVRVATTTAQ